MSETTTAPEVLRDYVFCPENGVSVGMEYTKADTPVEVKLAVTFCQDYVTLSKKEARTRLNERLNEALFKEDFCSNKYTCKVTYEGKSAKKDLLLPFLRYVTDLLAAFKTVKPLLKSVVRTSRDENKIKFYFNAITSFGLLRDNPLRTSFGLYLEQAQNLSACNTAKISIRGHKEVVWVKGSDTPLTKVTSSETNKKLVFKPMQVKVTTRLKKMAGWEPVFPKES